METSNQEYNLRTVRGSDPMDPVAGEFNFTRLEKVTFRAGQASRASDTSSCCRGLNRALIVTGKTLGRSKLLDKVTAASARAWRECSRARASTCPRIRLSRWSRDTGAGARIAW